MGIVDKAKTATEKAVGEVKEKVGKATDDHSMEAEGKTDQVKGSAKQAGENVKDTFQ